MPHDGPHERPPAAVNILVVEDDPDVREMIVGILSDLGYQISRRDERPRSVGGPQP